MENKNLVVNSDYLKSNAKFITEDDIEDANANISGIWKIFCNCGPLEHQKEDGRLLIQIIKDFRNKTYEITKETINIIVFTLLYVLNPLDLIPDMIFALGFLDDSAIVGICMHLIKNELKRYRELNHSLS